MDREMVEVFVRIGMVEREIKVTKQVIAILKIASILVHFNIIVSVILYLIWTGDWTLFLMAVSFVVGFFVSVYSKQAMNYGVKELVKYSEELDTLKERLEELK